MFVRTYIISMWVCLITFWVAAEVDAKGAKKGTERRLEILNRMRENPFVTQVKLMEEFNLSRKQIQNIIQYLRLNGLVEREGSNRSGKWIVKK